MNLKYSYNEFEILLSKISNHHYELLVECEIDDNVYSRVYDIKEDIEMVEAMGDEYVYFNLANGNHIQLKFEYGSCIVLDVFSSSNEHLEDMGAWDFNDDIE